LNPLLLEGLADAIGFVGGALVAWWVSMLLGFDPLAKGFENGTIAGIVLAGLGGGIGLQLARRWRASRKKDQ